MMCSVDGCRKRRYCRGWCKKHYNRVWRHGTTQASEPSYKFLARVDMRNLSSDSCWNWTGSISASGYGRFSHAGKKLRAHRFAWTLWVGRIPRGMQVLHHCDNPRCVRPSHLFIGTHIDNMRDMEAKGRARWIQENLRRKAA